MSDPDGLGNPGRVERRLRLSVSRRIDEVRAGDGGEGGVGASGSSGFCCAGSDAKLEVMPRRLLFGEGGALAESRPSSFIRVLVEMSGVELMRLGLNRRSCSALSSEPVRVPSSESASEGPARGEERNGRGSRRGPGAGDGAR